MATEIEFKAHAENFESLRAVLSKKAEYICAFEKNDTLWFPFPPLGLRVRTEKRSFPGGKTESAVFVTYKDKTVKDGIEINNEQEFEVHSPSGRGDEIFKDLLTRLQLRPGGGKRKKGWAYSMNGITVELHEVDGLGWFVELEIIADNDREETVARERKKLLEALASLGVNQDAIESRSYMQMLREKADKQ